MTTIKCPRCAADVTLDDAQIGTEIECPACRLAIVVTPAVPDSASITEAKPAPPAPKRPIAGRPIPNTSGGAAIAVCVLGSVIATAGTPVFAAAISGVTVCIVLTIIGTQIVRRLEFALRLLDEIRVSQQRDRENR